MPLSQRTVQTAGSAGALPFVGKIHNTDTVRVDISTLTTDEVDENGYVKPGVPLQADGDLISGTGQTVYGFTIEPIRVADDNSALASVTADFDLAIATRCDINQDVVEDILGRALSANELAGIAANPLLTLV